MQVPSRPSRFRRIRPELLLLLVSIAFSILLLEVVLRIHYSVTFSGNLDDLKSQIPPPGTEAMLGDLLTVSDFPRLVYQFKPHLVGVRWKRVSIDTNSLGFREATEPTPKDDQTVRIVGVGDSVMFGLGVAESERYMDVLEERLNEDFPNVRWETITFAVPGYNLVTEVEALKRYGLGYEPDLLIYGFIFNDHCLPNFISQRRPIWSFDSFIKYYLTRGGQGYPLLGRQFMAQKRDETAPGDLKEENPDLFEQTYCSEENLAPQFRHLVGKASFNDALAELTRIGRVRDVGTVFLSYGGTSRADKIQLPKELILVDLYMDYQKYLRDHGYANIRRSDLVLSRDDIHPSVKGHRLIGTALAERLVGLGLIEEILDRRGRAPRSRNSLASAGSRSSSP